MQLDISQVATTLRFHTDCVKHICYFQLPLSETGPCVRHKQK